MAAGLSQGALAERAGMSLEGVSALERGHRKTPKRETLSLLAGALALTEVQRHAFDAAARAPVTLGPWPGSGASLLPFALTTFVGRESELDEIAALVREHPLVTVVGAGGIGKTQTAMHVAADLGDAIGGAIVFVSLGPINDSSLVATAIASALGLREGPKPLLETLVAHLKDRRLLLILDNCEHVVAEAARIVEALLRQCPALRILATSRARLNMAGEWAYRLPSLDIQSAVELFTDRAASVHDQFDLSAESAHFATVLCRNLDGIPLAIELAAARAHSIPLKTLSEDLNDRLSLCASGKQKSLRREETMRATIDWSYDLLDEQDRRTFDRLSIFAGGCTLESAVAVCSDQGDDEKDVLNRLSSLIDRSLLVVETTGPTPRYRLLEPFREYAREKLEMRGEVTVAAHRHARAYLDLASRLEERRLRETDDMSLGLARADLENWRMALRWALTERGDIDLGQRLVAQTVRAWVMLASFEGKRWVDAAFELLDDTTPVRVRARLALAKAETAQEFHDFETWASSGQSAIDLYRSTGDDEWLARALSSTGHALFMLGRTREAKTLLAEALEKHGTLSDMRGAAYVHTVLSYLDRAFGDVGSARNHLLQARQLCKGAGATQSLAIVLMDLCDLELADGNPDVALLHITDALTASGGFVAENTGGLRRNRAVMIGFKAACLALLGRYDEAETTVSEALAMFREMQDQLLSVLGLLSLGAIAALHVLTSSSDLVDSFPRAVRLLGFAGARCQAIGLTSVIIHSDRHRVALNTLREAMGDERFNILFADGAAMTEEQAEMDIAALQSHWRRAKPK